MVVEDCGKTRLSLCGDSVLGPSPAGRRWTWSEAIGTVEGPVSIELPCPSSAASRHLLPAGEGPTGTSAHRSHQSRQLMDQPPDTHPEAHPENPYLESSSRSLPLVHHIGGHNNANRLMHQTYVSRTSYSCAHHPKSSTQALRRASSREVMQRGRWPDRTRYTGLKNRADQAPRLDSIPLARTRQSGRKANIDSPHMLPECGLSFRRFVRMWRGAKL